MLCIEASRAARASAICRRVSGECGREEGEVDVVGSVEEEGGGMVLLEDGRPGEREGAWVDVEAEAEAEADADADIVDARRELFMCLSV
jgi:hypothetical protein